MLVHFTQKAHIIPTDEYYLLFNKGARLWHELHRLEQTQVDRHPEWHEGSMSFLASGDANMYYWAPVSRDITPVELDLAEWHEFLDAVSLHFLGISHYEFRANQESYEGAPMFHLLQVVTVGMSVGVSGTKLMNAEFQNVTSDDADVDFIDWARQEFPGCELIYEKIARGLRDAAMCGGMMVLGVID